MPVGDNREVRGPLRPRGSPAWGALSVVAFVIALLAVEVARRAGAAGLAQEWAATPARIEGGRLWTLVTSALVLDRVHVGQLLLIVVLAQCVIRRHGARMFWIAAASAHVGATLVAYAGIGMLWVRSPAAAALVDHRADYGISCIWLGLVAMLAADLLTRLPAVRSRRARSRALLASVALTLAALSAVSDLATVEHILAVGAGAISILGAMTLREPVATAAEAPSPGGVRAWATELRS